MNAIASRRRHPVAAAILLGTLTALSFAAWSGETTAYPHKPLSVDVSYADLNLSHPDGALALYARLRTAARQLCGYDFTPSDLYHRVARKDCYDRTLNDAVQGVDSAPLKGLHAANERPSTIG